MRGGGPRAPGGGVSAGAGPCEGGAGEVGGQGVVVLRLGLEGEAREWEEKVGRAGERLGQMGVGGEGAGGRRWGGGRTEEVHSGSLPARATWVRVTEEAGGGRGSPFEDAPGRLLWGCRHQNHLGC